LRIRVKVCDQLNEVQGAVLIRPPGGEISLFFTVSAGKKGGKEKREKKKKKKKKRQKKKKKKKKKPKKKLQEKGDLKSRHHLPEGTKKYLVRYSEIPPEKSYVKEGKLYSKTVGTVSFMQREKKGLDKYLDPLGKDIQETFTEAGGHKRTCSAIAV